jgi:hypothetical protein
MTHDWAMLAGRWKREDSILTYLGPEDPGVAFAHGLALSSGHFRNGSVTARVSLEHIDQSGGGILFGYNSSTGAYFTAGLVGYGQAYVLSEFVPGTGSRGLRVLGSPTNLEADTFYELQLELQGQNVSLTVNHVKIFQEHLPSPLTGDQIGLYAWGQTNVTFEALTWQSAPPRAFVVMQFSEPFDTLYSDVIKPTSEHMGFEALRADVGFNKPGIILQDITRGILEAEIVIAEITAENANVFYELGYAHALAKPTILLAERGRQLPFDISGYRCIFYDNTIGGKTDVERNLKTHLKNILQET